jgi:uncharacterized protein with PQ loop repeat
LTVAAQRQDIRVDAAAAEKNAVIGASAASSAAASAASAASAATVASTAAVAAATAATAADAATAAVRASAAAAVAKEAAHLANRASEQAAVQHQDAVVAHQVAQQATMMQQTVVAQEERQVPVVVPLRSSSSWVSVMLQGLTFGAVVKALCMAGNVLVQVSPYPQVVRWEKRGCTGEVDAAPYVAIAFAGFQWCFYGAFAFLLTQRSGFLILVQSNCLGALLGSYYSLTFYKNCRNEEALSSFHRYLSAVGTLVAFQICTLSTLPAERSLFLTGLVASFCSFVGASSMLVPVPAVLKTRDSRMISGPLVFANCGSALVWCGCGIMLQDPLVFGPNVCAAMSSAVCIYLKLKFPSSDDKLDDKLEEGCDHTGEKMAMERTIGHKYQNQKSRKIGETTPLKASLPLNAAQTVEAAKDTAPSRQIHNDAARQVQAVLSCGETGGTL